MVVSPSFISPLWFSNDMAFSRIENTGASDWSRLITWSEYWPLIGHNWRSWCVVYCREFRSTIKYGLKVCWMLLNTFQIYLKTNSNCFRDKYANGRRTWRDFKWNSSDSAATWHLYKLQNFQIQRYTKKIFFQYYCSVEPTSLYMSPLYVTKFLGKRSFHQ